MGSGAAGSVLANRLSAKPNVRVLVLEAGHDLPPGKEPADIRSVFPLAAFNPAYMWPDTRVHWRGLRDSPAAPFPQGRALGGSSSIMGMWALRGMPGDYDEWAQLGAQGWSWKDVLPYFRKLETDIDFKGAEHGNDGPIPIRREPMSAWSPLALAVHQASMEMGYPHIEDANAEFRDGHCTLPNSRFERSRGASGICYLTAEVRSRPNLRILCERTVSRLILDGRRARGVVARAPDGSEVQFHGQTVILSAGALRSPALLMRSGIGPGPMLREAGVEVVADMRGVGRNLQNHAVLYALSVLAPSGREARAERPAGATYMRWSSREAGTPDGDMGLYVRSYLTWHALGRRMASLAPVLLRPAARGHIELDSGNPAGFPKIAFNLADNELDVLRLAQGLRMALTLFDSPAVRALCPEPFALGVGGKLMRYNQMNWKNAVRGWAGAAFLDVVPALGSRLLRSILSLEPLSSLIHDETKLREFIRSAVTGTGHVTGTCRMGRSSDAASVVDSHGRVHGVDNLIVADASIMPMVPSGNTHIPTVMIAEKLADSILDNQSLQPALA